MPVKDKAMDIAVSKFDLLRELQLTQGVVERKTTIPILSNLLLEASGDELYISATDLEMGIKTVLPAKVKTGGSATISARRLFEIVRTLPDAEIRMKELENHFVDLRCERSKFKLVGMSRENFPELAEFPTPLVKIPAAVLSVLIEKSIFAIAAEESRYMLNGALMILKPDSLTMVATDGTRLAHIQTEHELKGLKDEVKILVPRKALSEIERLLKEEDEKAQVEFARDDSHLFFKVGKRLLLSRMLTGQFPNYEAVMPRGNKNIVVIDRDTLSGAIRRADLVADQRSHAVRISLSSDKCEISASSPEYGEAQEEIVPAKPYKGDTLQIGFNATYVLDFLGVAAAGPISVEFKDEQSAGQMRPLAQEDYDYRYIVMPMRL